MTIRRKWLTVFVVVLVLSLIPTATGLAFFKSIFRRADQQCTQVYQAVEGVLGTSLDLGSNLYTLQEDVVHGGITALTGLAIPHGYIVIDVCGQSLPIDPPVVYNSVLD